MANLFGSVHQESRKGMANGCAHCGPLDVAWPISARSAVYCCTSVIPNEHTIRYLIYVEAYIYRKGNLKERNLRNDTYLFIHGWSRRGMCYKIQKVYACDYNKGQQIHGSLTQVKNCKIQLHHTRTKITPLTVVGFLSQWDSSSFIEVRENIFLKLDCPRKRDSTICVRCVVTKRVESPFLSPSCFRKFFVGHLIALA